MDYDFIFLTLSIVPIAKKYPLYLLVQHLSPVIEAVSTNPPLHTPNKLQERYVLLVRPDQVNNQSDLVV